MQAKSGIRNRAKVAKKALYLGGRTLDVADDNEVATYSDTGFGQSIPIIVAEVIGDLEIDMAEGPRGGFEKSIAQVSKPFERLARRLEVDEPRLAIHFALFLLDLALDTVCSDGILVVHSHKNSLRLPIKSNSESANVA